MGIFNLVIALAVVMGAYWALRTLAYTPPAQISGIIRKIGGAALIGVAGLLAVRGAIVVAVPLFAVGLGLMGYSGALGGGFPWQQKQRGQASRVKTQYFAMELDHDTGSMDGEVLAGPFAGRRLSSLSEGDLRQLYAQCGGATDQSRQLLEAWLDRTRNGWRERWEAPRAGGRPRPSTAMNAEEALAVLGLRKGASANDIRSAHRRLMKELHPDRGGSDYLAAKVNQAKDVLLQD
ncbi:MAG: DnaJ domain-containing protein [Hyphomicrobiales bacterium]